MSDTSSSLEKLLDLGLDDMDEVTLFNPTTTEKMEEDELDSTDEGDTLTISANGAADIRFEPIKLDLGSKDVPIAAVDASSITLGPTSRGVLVAFRAVVVLPDSIVKFGPFIQHVTESNKQRVFDLFAKDFGLQRLPAPPLGNVADRLRLLLERYAQRYASSFLQDGIILWDGAMTVGRSKFDTPPEMMKKLLEEASIRNNSVAGFSKTTELLLSDGQKLLSVIEDEVGPTVADVSRKIVMPPNSTYRVMGRTFAVKLAQQGFPFRVDVSAHNGNHPIGILADIIQSGNLFHGYPEALRQAHIHAKLTADEVIACQRWVVQTYKIPIVGIPDMHKMLLAPFG